MQSKDITAQVDKNFKTTPINRITLFCRDLDRSLSLYRDILGFNVIETKTIQSTAFNNLMNIEDENCSVRICYLQSEESEFGLIALFEINSLQLDKNEAVKNSSIQYGQNVIVLSTNDHEKIYKELKKLGYIFLVEPIKYIKAEDSDYIKAGAYLEMSFFDPDGFLINLIQYN